MVSPGIGLNPPVITRVGMPSVWESTAENRSLERIYFAKDVEGEAADRSWLSPNRTGLTMGRRSVRAPSPDESPVNCVRIASTLRPHIRPWQIPRPARVVNFADRNQEDSVFEMVSQNDPYFVSSQRHNKVSCSSHFVQPLRMPCAASSLPAK